MAADPRALEMLVTLFAGSQFLTDILLRTPEHFAEPDPAQRHRPGQKPEQHYAEAYRAACGSLRAGCVRCRPPRRWTACAGTSTGSCCASATCDLIGLLDLTTVTAQLSHLADSVIWVCLELLARSLGMTTEGFVVLGMGKLGGGELNYSSDIDLLFLADDERRGATSGWASG